jgi:hypothetical protein
VRRETALSNLLLRSVLINSNSAPAKEWYLAACTIAGNGDWVEI